MLCGKNIQCLHVRSLKSSVIALEIEAFFRNLYGYFSGICFLFVS